LDDTSAQPAHTPMSAIILGFTLLGYTFLGVNIRNNPPTSPPSQGGRALPCSKGLISQLSSQGTYSQPQQTMDGRPPTMPYMTSLKIVNLTKLTKDSILCDPTWPNMPTKLPYDIPKFEGKL
jgi:hypothetical protein